MTCTYLLTRFPGGVAVTGRDVLGLDSNGNGTVCGPGDDGEPHHR